MILFCDSSALTKRYVVETGSAWVSTHADPSAGNSIIVAEITRVEVAAALAASQRAATITPAERDDLVSLVLQHFDAEYTIIAVEPVVTSQAVVLTQRHRLRGYDAVQLAAALVANQQIVAAGVSALVFVAADNDLLAAAQAEGLATENPNHY